MPAALAIAAHPDDIEFVMAGTLLQLRAAGWEIHYCNLSNGDLGSTVMTMERTAAVRRKEAQAAARLLGAKWHPPFSADMAIFYDENHLRRLCAVVRAVKPSIILTHALEDYMEDHMTTARLAVSATFARGIPNYRSRPVRPPSLLPCTLYHAMPHGLRSPMRVPVQPECFVDTTRVHVLKREALACHASQLEWLDRTQGMDSYVETMEEFSRKLGKHSRKFQHAEGWSRHLHLGFGGAEDDPLRDALGAKRLKNPAAPT